MPKALEQIRFTTRVLGPVTAYRLEKHQVSQTLRANRSGITESILNGRVTGGAHLEVVLDGIPVGRAAFVSMDAVTWEVLEVGDARRGGFDSLDDLELALKQAGYRFRPLNDYQLYRIQFMWLRKPMPEMAAR